MGEQTGDVPTDYPSDFTPSDLIARLFASNSLAVYSLLALSAGRHRPLAYVVLLPLRTMPHVGVTGKPLLFQRYHRSARLFVCLFDVTGFHRSSSGWVVRQQNGSTKTATQPIRAKTHPSARVVDKAIPSSCFGLRMSARSCGWQQLVSHFIFSSGCVPFCGLICQLVWP